METNQNPTNENVYNQNPNNQNPSGENLTFAVEFDGAAGGAARGGKVRVPALVFRAGEYPDKGVTITEADLDGVIARFQAEGTGVPIRVEHRETPLDPLGEVVSLYRDGAELYGLIVFPAGIAEHLRERGAGHLSASFRRDDSGYRLHETSIVFTPRVLGAGFLPPPGPTAGPTVPPSPEMTERAGADLRRGTEFRTADVAATVAARVAGWQAAGKLTPAMAGPVARLLSVGSSLDFAGGGGAGGADLTAEVAALIDAIPVRLVPVGGPTPGVPGERFPAPDAPPTDPFPGLDDGQRSFLAALRG